MGQELKVARQRREQISLKELIQEANEFHNLANRTAKDMLNYAIESGRRLMEAKKKCQHGKFEQLFDDPDGLDMPLRTGQRYMKIAREWDDYGLSYGQAANISITEGLARIKSAKDTYYPPDITKSDTVALLAHSGGPEPVDGTAECPHGGEHEYDDEACVRCHDPKPTAPDSGSRAAAASSNGGRTKAGASNQQLDRDREVADRFNHLIHLCEEAIRLADELRNMKPYPDFEAVEFGLKAAYDNFQTWRSSK